MRQRSSVNIAELATGIIKEFEGFRADAYPDPRTGDEPWTIGYGTTVYANGTKVKRGDKVTEQQASIELIQKVAKLMNELEQVILVPLTDGQMACMVSFAYNVGISGSGLQIARLNNGLDAEFKRKHLEYVNKGSNVEAGLLRRRKAELKLFDMEDKMDIGVATLKRTGKKRGNGLEILALEFGGELFECVSGQPWAQSFRKPGDPRSVPGCMEPIPMGDYKIGNIEWAGGKDNYDASWGPGLGPVWVPLPATFADDRSSFGIHLDSNASTSPGSAGCVVIPNISKLKRLVAALRKHDPKLLRVVW